MDGVAADPNDIVEINAGGEVIIQCHRRTLCLAPDSMFSNLFSSRWEGSWARDSQGRVFFDHDPEVVRLIVNHLRIKRIDDLSDPFGPPKVPETKRKEFFCLLRYFGLDSFFFPVPFLLDCPNIEVVQSNGSNFITVEKTEQNLKLTFNGNRHHFAACKPMIPSGPCWWKVTIDKLPINCWVYLGVIGDLNASESSNKNSTAMVGHAMAKSGKKGRNKTLQIGLILLKASAFCSNMMDPVCQCSVL